jgi:hypothetical protein
MRYLEQCIADLKTAHRRDSPSSIVSEKSPPPFRKMRDEEDEQNEDNDEDEDMADAEPASPTYVPAPIPKSTYQFPIEPSDHSIYSHSTTTSPAMLPRDRGLHSAGPSPALRPSDPHHYSLTRSSVTSPSIQASPAFSAMAGTPHFSNPFHTAPPGSSHSAAAFSLNSPALLPQEDHEATEALLMLNTDRRSWSGARGMSVKDLLSG